MNNGYQKSNGCGADKEGGEFFKTFFFTKLQSKHVRPLAYNGSGLCVVALSINLKLTTTLDRAITQNPCCTLFFFGSQHVTSYLKINN